MSSGGRLWTMRSVSSLWGVGLGMANVAPGDEIMDVLGDVLGVIADPFQALQDEHHLHRDPCPVGVRGHPPRERLDAGLVGGIEAVVLGVELGGALELPPNQR